MKSAEEIMEILEAFDLTSSYRDAAELAGCDHHTVARYVAAREAGRLTADPATRAMVVDPYRAKLEEWVERSRGKLRAAGRRGPGRGRVVCPGATAAGRGRPA